MGDFTDGIPGLKGPKGFDGFDGDAGRKGLEGLLVGFIEINPYLASFFCAENVCFLRLLHIFKCTSD